MQRTAAVLDQCLGKLQFKPICQYPPNSQMESSQHSPSARKAERLRCGVEAASASPQHIVERCWNSQSSVTSGKEGSRKGKQTEPCLSILVDFLPHGQKDIPGDLCLIFSRSLIDDLDAPMSISVAGYRRKRAVQRGEGERDPTRRAQGSPGTNLVVWIWSCSTLEHRSVPVVFCSLRTRSSLETCRGSSELEVTFRLRYLAVFEFSR
jgi:hypothetical protein